MEVVPNIQDRTFEFQQAVNTFAKQQHVESRSAPAPKPSTQKSEFNRQAGYIAKDIVRVTGALHKLAQLSKRKQLFGDKPTDIVELTYMIKQDIFKIEKELKGLKSLQVNGLRGDGDTQIKSYHKNIVQLLNTKTKNISENFKDVLEARQRAEFAQRNRQEQLLSEVRNSGGDTGKDGIKTSVENNVPFAIRSNNLPNGIASDNPFLAGIQLQELSEQKKAQATQDAIHSYGENGNLLSLPDQNQQLLLLEEQNNQYLQERSNAVDAIESTINEVGGLFQQLATMVQEQGEVIQRIDDNVEDVSLNIQGAQRELMKYYKSVSSNRWLMMKIFGIIIAFFLLWVLVS